jgi:hypothetical protein
MDRQTLNLIAATLCGVGSFAALLEARSFRSVASSLFGLIGSAAWAASAYQDYAEQPDNAATPLTSIS